MKTILISTSSLWNCGDDFIRMGVLNLLQIDPLVRTLWWNRAYGVSPTFANDLDVNLRASDYFLVAGTPEWVARHDNIYEHCLAQGKPIAMIGVGMRGGARTKQHSQLLRRVAKSGLVELTLVRDQTALNFLRAHGFKDVELMIDPAFMMTTFEPKPRHDILCWRDATLPGISPWHDVKAWVHRLLPRRPGEHHPARWINDAMRAALSGLADPKLIVVHDNREIEPAQRLFPGVNVFHATDPLDMLRVYASARRFVGTRIHGAIAAAVHGATCRLLYSNKKATVIEDSIGILSRHVPEVKRWIQVSFLSEGNSVVEFDNTGPMDRRKLLAAIDAERQRVRAMVHSAPQLRSYVHLAADDSQQRYQSERRPVLPMKPQHGSP